VAGIAVFGAGIAEPHDDPRNGRILFGRVS
jgi:hypothetical protein